MIKLNRSGTLTSTLAAIAMAVAARYSALASDLSGGAEDTTIAELEVFAAATQSEAGSGCRAAHVAKYNRLP